MSNWDKKFFELSQYIASWSKDRSTKVGSVIVNDNHVIVSIGYNGFPIGFNDDVDERHERPIKYKYTEHAERNAIYNAAKIGISTKDCTIYVSLFPCADCARAIIQSGIKKIVCIEPDWNHDVWGTDFKISKEMFNECGVEILFYKN